MQNRLLLAVAYTSSLASVLAAPAVQAQSLADCGRINVEAEAECEVKSGVTCKTMCEPVNVRAACAAQLTADCDAKCSKLPSVQCNVDCDADCHVKCDPSPGKFDCSATCQADCSGSCSARCEGSDDSARCEASCEGSCAVSCQGKCEVELPEANCDAKCEASCSGSCEADPNLDCQIDCQAELYADCEVDLQGGCKVDCDSQEGALFCDGKYVDHGDHLDKCVNAIEAFIDANVDGYAEGSSSCTNGSCMAEGKAGASCSVQPGAPASRGTWWLGASVAAVFVARQRRRRPTQQ